MDTKGEHLPPKTLKSIQFSTARDAAPNISGGCDLRRWGELGSTEAFAWPSTGCITSSGNCCHSWTHLALPSQIFAISHL